MLGLVPPRLLLLYAVGQTALAAVLDLNWGGRSTDKLYINIPWLPFASDNETRCYDELGCLNITRQWYHLIYRPINVFPLPRQVIDTKFLLYTRKNPTQGHMISTQRNSTIAKSHFDARRETKVIIHGFIDTPLSSWVKDMRKELLIHADWNVIVVDWAGGSLPLYTQATANTRLVALELAHLLNFLKDNYGLDPGMVHIIGHSLGAHTAGYTGERLPGLGRITGLDPAEPYFQGTPPIVRLDPTDAKLVDVIHTDGASIIFLGYGMSTPCGHIDFYPNNGKQQPGCDLAETPVPLTLIREGIEEASRVLVACNHIRAIKLFTDSINTKCPYVAHQCDSYEHFLQGRCFDCATNSSSCAVMGMHATDSVSLATPGSKFFITTGKDFPYCRRHYKVTVELAKPTKAEAWVQGYMKISMHSDTGVIRNLDLTPTGYVKLQHGTSRSFVVSHPADVRNIRKVEFFWEYDMNVLEPQSICLLWCNDHLYVSRISVAGMDISPRSKRQLAPRSVLCATGDKDYADVASRSSVIFDSTCDSSIVH